MSWARWAGRAVVALALVFATSACADVVDGSGAARARLSTLAPAPTSGAPAPPSGSSSIPPGPEFSTIRYDIPKGFTATTGFVQEVPLEDSVSKRYYVTPAAHTDGTAGVISIIVYNLEPGLDVSTSKAQVARIGYYNKLLKVKVTAALKATTLAGRPAWTESVIEPPNFVYTTWFLFGKTHVLQFTCQLGAPAANAQLTLGCGQLRDSLQTN